MLAPPRGWPRLGPARFSSPGSHSWRLMQWVWAMWFDSCVLLLLSILANVRSYWAVVHTGNFGDSVLHPWGKNKNGESLFGFGHGEHQKDNHGDWRRKRAEREQRGGWESIWVDDRKPQVILCCALDCPCSRSVRSYLIPPSFSPFLLFSPLLLVTGYILTYPDSVREKMRTVKTK